MNERRARIIAKVFVTLDRDASGKLTVEDIGIL